MNKDFCFGNFQNISSRHRGGPKLSNVAEFQTRSILSSLHLTSWTQGIIYFALHLLDEIEM